MELTDTNRPFGLTLGAVSHGRTVWTRGSERQHLKVLLHRSARFFCSSPLHDCWVVKSLIGPRGRELPRSSLEEEPRRVFLVAMAEGSHPIPSRTRSLSLPAPMVLQGRPCGRVGRRQIYGPLGNEGAFFIGSRRARQAGRVPCRAVPVWSPRPSRASSLRSPRRYRRATAHENSRERRDTPIRRRLLDRAPAAGQSARRWPGLVRVRRPGLVRVRVRRASRAVSASSVPPTPPRGCVMCLVRNEGRCGPGPAVAGLKRR